MIKNNDIVELLKDQSGIQKGSIGTVVETWDDGKAYSVEFLDNNGNVIDCIAVVSENLNLVKKFN